MKKAPTPIPTRRGRPPERETRATAFLHLRITPARKARYAALAHEAGRSLAQWIYDKLDAK